MPDSKPQNAPNSASAPKQSATAPKSAAAKSATAPKPTTILLIRHAETPTTGKVLPGRAAGLGLSDKGIAQAEARAADIAGKHQIAAIYSSPMERAQQTAAPIGAATSAKSASTKVSTNAISDFGRGGVSKPSTSFPHGRRFSALPATSASPKANPFWKCRAA